MSLYPLALFINLIVGLTASLLLGAGAIRLAWRYGLIDVPGALPHKQHDRPTPLAGGLTLAASLVVGLAFDRQAAITFWRIWPGLAIIFLFGLWDDKSRLSPHAKLAGQVLAASSLLALDVSVRMIKPAFLDMGAFWSNAANMGITLFWVVGMTNAFNLIDSMDGLLVGISGISLAFMMLMVLSAGDERLLRLLALLLGIVIGLYFYNAAPARFFLGDSGAQSLGYLLAVMALLFTPGGRPQASSWFVPVLILAVPIFDTTLVVFSRLRRGAAPFRAGRDHTYHRLTRIGLEPRRAVVALHIGAVVVGSLAFIAFLLPPWQANLLFATLFVAALGMVFWLEGRNGN